MFNSHVTDEVAHRLLQQLALHSPNEEGFLVHQGIIRRQQQIWFGNNSTLRTKLISVLHDSAYGGHSRIGATYLHIKKMFWWNGLKTNVEQYVRQCGVCQQSKGEKSCHVGLLQPLPVPKGAWEYIMMDSIEKLPKSEGCDTIMVVVDRFSNYARFFALRHPFTTVGVAQIVLQYCQASWASKFYSFRSG